MIALIITLLVLFVLGAALIAVGKQLLTGIVNTTMNIRRGNE